MDVERKIVNANECQFASLEGIAEGNAPMPPTSIARDIKLAIRRNIDPKQDRTLHQKADAVLDCFSTLLGNNDHAAKPAVPAPTGLLKAGDVVRVKSKEEIEATLNHLGQAKGCSFMADIMTPYCGTVQRVLRPMERFVDERDLRVKKCKGLILLEDAVCQGTTAFGPCDRACHMFWREEWLEKVDEPQQQGTAVPADFAALPGEGSVSAAPADDVEAGTLQAGDLVRVKSKEEIESTLNYLGQTKGCAFMPDVMTPYCGTVQRVLKPMGRFVNEKDLRVKNCSGLVLLDGLMCPGDTAFGQCDRCCSLFWREEWLEKVK